MDSINTRLTRVLQDAESCMKRNDIDAAVTLFSEACRLDPGNTHAWNMLGVAHGMLGQYDLAESACRQALKLVPDIHAVQTNLASILMLQGKRDEAGSAFRRILVLNPQDVHALNNLGNLYMQLGRTEDAIDCYRKAISFDPSGAEAYNNISMAYRASNRPDEAILHCKKALALNPTYADAYCNLGALLVDQLDIEEAETCYRKALQYQPNSKAAHSNMGKLLQTKGLYNEAIQSYEHALRLSPGDPDTMAAMAGLYQRLGQVDAAQKFLNTLASNGAITVAAAINQASMAHDATNIRNSVDILTSLLNNRPSINDQADIHFALGGLHESSKEYDAAFEHYHTGNRLDSHKYANSGCEHLFEQFITTFSQEQFANLPRSLNTSELPIFIVGMPRSGTTLVEQILSSHPDLFGGGELASISLITESLQSNRSITTPYPSCISQLSSKFINHISDTFITEMTARAGKASRITDKTPLHFMELGFINLLLPNTRIIHCSRTPLDTCLSIYFHRFNKYHAYACDLPSLGHFYRQYEKLMRHWRSILDIPILDVVYEDLVENTEDVSRKIVNFCGLPWNDNCLRFYENKRIADTPSYNQVRREIYSSSINRWEHYAGHIQALKNALDTYK